VWPQDAPTKGSVVVLADASSQVEMGLIEDWLGANRPPEVTTEIVRLAPSRRRRPGQRTDTAPVEWLEGDGFLLPLRVVWSPAARAGERKVSWWDVLKLGDPRDPDALRQRVILARWPDRVGVVAGKGSKAAALAAEHEGSELSLAEWTTRRAWRALDIAERALRGDRYKVPRFLHEEITSQPSFRRESVALGARRKLPEAVALARAKYYLKEIAASPSAFVIDLSANVISWVIRQGYGEMAYDRGQVAEINALGREWPLAFLPSHRSNLDRLVLQLVKWENDLPPNHTAGGINMNFFPVGPWVRRTGVFFIRRSFRNNDLYKFVLQTYLDYLVENRFPLEWYMEGGRSRTGKLLPPRYGLLAYVVDSWRRGKSEDLMLVPVSIVYDQIQDLGSYTTEAQGGAKEAESMGWALRYVRSLRRRYGNIHLRFGEPISVAKAMAGAEVEEGSTDLAKLALEVMHRIGTVTPITPASVLAIALLAAAGEARTQSELASFCEELDILIEQLGLPTTEPLKLEEQAEVGNVLRLLAEHHNVSAFEGTEVVYYLNPQQSLRASYYRNLIAHHFLGRAVLELSLEGLDPRRPVTETELLARVAAWRDLLKFEYFFPEKEAFADSITADLRRIAPRWQSSKPATVLAKLHPPTASWVIRPLLQSYLVVADELLAHPNGVSDEKAFITACLKRGEQYRLQGIIGADGVSAVVFKQALALAHNRELVESPEGRADFAAEIRSALGAGDRPPESPRSDEKEHQGVSR
jgi:glycerol-3-phosphate O-acyltransferase